MVDLDSNPTKLIEIVAIGKQLLITRGALTTFSIANDVAKYFAIIPAMFMATYPALGALNIMGLHTPQSAVLAAVIFNALIIIALVPLALRGVKYRPQSAAAMLRRNLLDLRRRRHHRAVSRHLGDRSAPRPAASGVRFIMWSSLCSGTSHHARHDGPDRPGLSGARHRPSPGAVSQRRRTASSDRSNGKVVGSELIGQNFTRPEYFHPRPSAAGAGYDARRRAARTTDRRARSSIDRVKASVEQYRKENPDYTGPIPADAVTASASGLDPHISPANAEIRSRAWRRRAAPMPRPVRALVAAVDRAPVARFHRRAARQRAAAEPRARRTTAAQSRQCRSPRRRSDAIWRSCEPMRPTASPRRRSRGAAASGRGRGAGGTPRTAQDLPGLRVRRRQVVPAVRRGAASPRAGRGRRRGRAADRHASRRRATAFASSTVIPCAGCRRQSGHRRGGRPDAAIRRSAWSTAWPTTIHPAAGTPSATRTSRSCSTPASPS